jgi:hypothetical protein
MEIPTIQHEILSRVHLIGGEKGGVGKSMVSRLMAQYFIDHQIPFVGFDTDRSHGSLLRFYADYASPALVDRYEALDAHHRGRGRTARPPRAGRPGGADARPAGASGWTIPACSTWPTCPASRCTTGT